MRHLFFILLFTKLLCSDPSNTAVTENEVTHFIGHVISKEQLIYDSFGRLIKQIDPLGHVTTIDYDPKINQKIQTDPMGLKTIETFDCRGRLASLEKRKDGKTLLLQEIKYDPNSNKIWQCDTIEGRQVVTQWEYNCRDRLERQIEGNGLKTTRYTYWPTGELKQLCKPDGTTLDYEYNHLGVVTLLTSSDGTVHHEMTYNRKGELLTFDGITRTLDPRGRVTKEIFPQGFCTTTEFDNRGRKKVVTCGGIEAVYKYGQLDLESVTCGPLVHRYEAYDLSGNFHRERLIGGLGRVIRDYDLLSRNRQIQAPAFTQKVLEFDAVGNIHRMEVRGEEHSYTYDSLYQLTSESGAFVHDYAHDALLNRIRKDRESFEINALNQLEGVFQYDLNGNPLQVDGLKLTYDALDRLIRVEGRGFVQTLGYDYLNRCLSKTTNGVTVYLLYEGQNEVGSLNAKLELQELRVLGATPHAEIGAAVALWLQGSWYAPVHDLQGNVATLLPLDEGEPTQYSFGAFGEEKVDGEAANPWRFSSKRTDEQTGFINYGRRYYLPKYGRWLSPDPLGFTAGVNLYAFVNNDPLTTLDEYGLHDVGSLAMLHRWKGDGYAVSPRDQNLMKGYAGAAHGAVQFGVNVLHGWQAMATQIGVEQLELGRHGREAAISAVERMQSSQSFALDYALRNQFSISRTDVSYNTGYAAGMYGAEIGSVIGAGYGIAKGIYTVGRMGYASWRAGGKCGSGAFSATERLGTARVPKATRYTRSNFQIGQKMHKEYKMAENDAGMGMKEYLLPSGRRTDFIDPLNGIIYELKPYNPRSIRLGLRQLELYKQEIKTVPEFKDIDWKIILETY